MTFADKSYGCNIIRLSSTARHQHCVPMCANSNQHLKDPGEMAVAINTEAATSTDAVAFVTWQQSIPG